MEYMKHNSDLEKIIQSIHYFSQLTLEKQICIDRLENCRSNADHINDLHTQIEVLQKELLLVYIFI